MIYSKNTSQSWKSVINNKYRLVILNEETFEEVTSFKLSRMGVYIAFCTVFVLLVTLTVGFVVFTPMKYYIPGYGNYKQRQEIVSMNMRIDSLQRVMVAKGKYLQDIKQVLSGNFKSSKLDTTQLKIPNVANSTN
jgi:hypothetical protein